MNRRFWKVLSLVAVSFAALVMIVNPAWASTVKHSGTWGTCPWEITDDGVLTVHPGKGAEQTESEIEYTDYSSPWFNYRDDVTSVVFTRENGQAILAPANCRSLFLGLENVVTMDLSGLDTSKTTLMITMFAGCTSLNSLNLFGFNTSNVTNMDMMFADCSSLTELNLSSFNTSNVLSLTEMFYMCSNLSSLDLSSFETSNVVYFSSMFCGCSSLASLDVSNFDTSSAQDLSGMFNRCSTLKSLNLSSFNTANAISVSGMFYGCTSLGELTVGEKFIQPDDYWSAPDGNWKSTSTGLVYSGYDLAHQVRADTYHRVFIDISNATISDIPDRIFRGEPIWIFLTVTLDGKQLVENEDYYVEYSNIDRIGTATVTVVGMGNYSGSKSVNFKLTAWIGDADIADIPDQIYSGAPITPELSVILNGETLVAGTDYDLWYGDNINAGVARVVISNSTGGTTRYFNILPADLSNATITTIPNQTWTGSDICPAFYVILNGRTLAAGVDYDVSFSNNVSLGTATVMISGKGNYSGTATGSFVISAVNISGASVTVADQAYTGSALTPAVTVRLNGKTLVSGTDYSVSYSNNVNVGIATVTVTGKGNYTGTATGNFKINSAPVQKTGWQKENGGYYFYNNDGTLQKNTWKKVNGAYYYLGSDGKLVVNGWAKYNGKYYFMGSNGQPVKNGWVKYAGKYYYIKNYNPVVNTWVKYGGKYYYLNSSGNPVVNGWVKYGGKYYYMNGSGNPVVNNWVSYGGKWYHFGSNGACDRVA